MLVLASGAGIGWLYGQPQRGLLLASLAALIWQSVKLRQFEQALRTRNFEAFRFGEGIWQEIFSRFNHLRNRSRKHKHRYHTLLKEMRATANAMPDAGIVLNAGFEIQLCNHAAKKLVGVRSRLDRGQRVDNIVRDPRFAAYLSSADHNPGVEIVSPLKEQEWLFCRLVPYGPDQYLLFIRDITESRRLATLRREFVANASHELRSPLTVICGYLDALADDDRMPMHLRKPVGQMQSQAQRMNNIVAELLELSRLEAAGPAGSGQRMDIETIVNSAISNLAGPDRAATIEVNIVSAAGLFGHASEIESVVANLLSNALRHTPAEGRVTVQWNADAESATLTVTDTGEGIAEEHLPRLTERFFRVDSGRARDAGGVGLGLAIVKHVLLRHDAQLHIESRPGEGSRFSCRFDAVRIAR